ncbi:MAG: hypothetical protein HY657_02755 [Acidobacteria bacterium]|nr:hypothetical protein [Acidobacteriota bacterium]
MRREERVTALEQRIDRFEARVNERFDAIDRRFEAVGQRFEKLERRIDKFEARVEARFTAIEARLDALEQRADARMDEIRRHFDVVSEASREDFRNLYDLLVAQIARTDSRVDTMAAELRAEMRLGDAALDKRITALERSGRPKKKQKPH